MRCLPFTKAVWWLSMSCRMKDCNLLARVFVISFRIAESTLMGRKSEMVAAVFFLGTRVM
jgi:hypothetical protein